MGSGRNSDLAYGTSGSPRGRKWRETGLELEKYGILQIKIREPDDN